MNVGAKITEDDARIISGLIQTQTKKTKNNEEEIGYLIDLRRELSKSGTKKFMEQGMPLKEAFNKMKKGYKEFSRQIDILKAEDKTKGR